MRQIINIRPVGGINRRSLPTMIGDTEVLDRQNFLVVGVNKESLFLKKFPGANRFNSTAAGATFQSGIRWYTKKDVRRTFTYNTNGYIYYFDENGNTTQLIGVFSPLAIPAWEIIRVTDTDILYFSEGVSTGMYSFDGNLDNVFNKEVAV